MRQYFERHRLEERGTMLLDVFAADVNRPDNRGRSFRIEASPSVRVNRRGEGGSNVNENTLHIELVISEEIGTGLRGGEPKEIHRVADIYISRYEVLEILRVASQGGLLEDDVFGRLRQCEAQLRRVFDALNME